MKLNSPLIRGMGNGAGPISILSASDEKHKIEVEGGDGY